jgi:hypothetical protein
MQTFKRYLLSSTITFVTGFSIAVLPTLGSLAWDKSAIFALFVVGLRAGFKALGEWMVGTTADRVPANLPTDF